MNIYAKLQEARCELQNIAMKKSGNNKFAGYSYFELSDFLPSINTLMLKHKISGYTQFTNDLATLVLVNTEEPTEQIIFTSPMGTAALKGCHEVQNIGAVETYQRRYLYMAAFEIVEHDVIDGSTAEEADKPKGKSESSPIQKITANEFKKDLHEIEDKSINNLF